MTMYEAWTALPVTLQERRDAGWKPTTIIARDPDDQIWQLYRRADGAERWFKLAIVTYAEEEVFQQVAKVREVNNG